MRAGRKRAADPAEGDRGDQPVERFRPTTGAFVGWTGIALALAAVCYAATVEHSLAGLRLGLGAAFGAVLVWVTQLRPRLTAYPRHLRLHGSLRDIDIPYLAVNEVSLGQTLNVHVGRKRYVCTGIGRSVGYEMRQRVRSRGEGGNSLGGNRSYQFAGRAETSVVNDRGPTYSSFVLDRVNDLLAIARGEQDRGEVTDPDLTVRRTPAVPELAALLVTGLGFLVSLLL